MAALHDPVSFRYNRFRNRRVTLTLKAFEMFPRLISSITSA